MKHILITAYDVNPYQGSESATGWNYPYHLSKYNKITVVTRENNLPEIRRFIAENQLNVENLKFVGFDLPVWARFWKKGARGSFLYFYLWQFFLSISFFSKRNEFDVCHSLNFHCDWAPSFLWLLGKPFIWGPINHNETLPDYVLKGLTKGELRKEKVKQIFKWFFWNLDPFLFICKIKADKILVGHSGVVKRLGLLPSKCVLFNQIATDVHKKVDKNNHNGFNVLFIGRGLLIKNYLAVLDAFKICLENTMISNEELSISFVGVGKNAKNKLLTRALELDVEQHLSVHEWVGFQDIEQYYLDANVFCFPSYEGAGMVIAEALSYGIPVITIDKNGAAHELTDDCAFVISSSDKDEIISGISNAITLLINDKNKYKLMCDAAYSHTEKKLSWHAKSKAISNIYTTIL
ncbi:glycosyltransferase family 4 protein [Colwellia sp. MB02u-6]|uniref:glycosyltransferase family 4 protein n=1 Tax=Colwellia sp. MB02u-6 TaxID=2759824 RepID=UPI0015F6067F|nr:glycosyltransferase family 4 protein [Colwellia sp. MB02u-6]MBA6328374.1 glycosyltransferase family 4 protein [Colwellia sp. MB02u-6]